MNKWIMGAAVALAGALGSAPVFADGGYYTGPLGARAAGRGGSFVARADDVTAISVNPAGLANLRGTHLEIGNQVSYNGYSYTRAPTLDWGNAQNNMAPLVTFAKVSNGTPAQAADPFIGLSTDFGLPDWTFGVAAFAPPGIAQEQFPTTGGQNYMMVHREAIILDGALTAAWKYHDLFGLGVTAEWLPVPRLDYSLVINANPFAGAANPVSSPLDLLADTKGSSWTTFNARLGTWVRPVPWLELAAAGQVVPTSFVVHSTLTATGLDPSVGQVLLTRNGTQASDVTITLPLPMMARGGARYIGLNEAGIERFDIEADVEYETWSRVNSFTLDTAGLMGQTASNMPVTIGRIVVPKSWRDTVSVKLGGDVAIVPDRWTVRGGVYYESAVASPAYANVDFSGGPQLGAALGGSFLSHGSGDGWELAVTYQLRYQPSVSVSEADARVYQQVPGSSCTAPYTDTTACNSHYLGQPAPAINAGTYTAASHLVSLAFLYRFGVTPTHKESQP